LSRVWDLAQTDDENLFCSLCLSLAGDGAVERYHGTVIGPNKVGRRFSGSLRQSAIAGGKRLVAELAQRYTVVPEIHQRLVIRTPANAALHIRGMKGALDRLASQRRDEKQLLYALAVFCQIGDVTAIMG